MITKLPTTSNYLIHCRTHEEYLVLLQALDPSRFRWNSGDPPCFSTGSTYWDNRHQWVLLFKYPEVSPVCRIVYGESPFVKDYTMPPSTTTAITMPDFMALAAGNDEQELLML